MMAAAKQFLNDLAFTQAGHEYMVNDANMLPAFSNVELLPTTPLTLELVRWSERGKVYSWWQNDMPSGFGMDTLGPIYERFAKNEITRQQFIAQVTSAIQSIS